MVKELTEEDKKLIRARRNRKNNNKLNTGKPTKKPIIKIKQKNVKKYGKGKTVFSITKTQKTKIRKRV
jgi:hypothetical protein